MVRLRTVSEKDCKLLFSWANDKEVRKNSFNTESITYEEHVRWFLKILKNNNILFLIMEFHKQPVGQIRVNIENNNAVISYSICEGYRGKGFGTKIIQLMEKKLNSLKTINKISAYVKKENGDSNKIFTKLNYLKKEFDDKNLYYKLIKS